jgi:hypothetical protein
MIRQSNNEFPNTRINEACQVHVLESQLGPCHSDFSPNSGLLSEPSWIAEIAWASLSFFELVLSLASSL